ncbi:MAG: hypothetical protein U0359_15030 [Byssovorax sp.]
MRLCVKNTTVLLAISLPALLALPGCETYEGPPRVTLSGETDGTLPEPKDPIVLSFSKPADPKTVRVKIARYVTDVEGNLGDEDADPNTNLDVLFETDPDTGDSGGVANLSPDGTALTIKPITVLPVGAALVVLIEPGLADEAGHTTKVRKRIVFSYAFDLKCNAPSAVFAPGAYFVLAEVKKPIPVQVKLFAKVLLDPVTGAFTGQFTNASRNKDPDRCPMPCKSTEVCRLLPMPACVAPSERAGSVDEFSDFVPNFAAPTGFSFEAHGCAVDQGADAVLFSSAPTDVHVQQPDVTLRNTILTASFVKEGDGTLRATGSLTADDVLLGNITSGPGQVGLTMRSIPEDQVPPDLPEPGKPLPGQ